MNNSQNYKSPSGTAPNRLPRPIRKTALRAYSLLRTMVSPLFTGHPFTKPHVPCVAANRKRNRLPRPFAKPRFALTRCFAKWFRLCSRDTHSQNRTFRASLLRSFVLFINGRPLRPADLSNFHASMKFVQI